MKKEKTIRAYKRKTKSGKVVNVRQHTAKYDAAEEFKKAMQKKGAGDELERKLTDKELKQVESIISENSELDPEYLAAFYPELSTRMIKEVMHQYRKKSAVPTPAARAKAEKLPKSGPNLGSDSISKEDYKAWYNWDMVDDPKNEAALRVKKALTKKMGAKGYAAYEKQMSDSWSARGYSKAYSALGKDAVADKTPKSLSGEGSKKALTESEYKKQMSVLEDRHHNAHLLGKRATSAAQEKKYDQELKGIEQEIRDLEGKRKSSWKSALPVGYEWMLEGSKKSSAPKIPQTSEALTKKELAQLRNYYATDVKAHKRGVYVYTTMDEGEKKTATAAQLRKMMRDFDAKPSTREAMVAAKAGKLAKKDMDFVRKKASTTKTKTIKVGGKPYYIWKDADGGFRGSHENPASRITNGNGVAKFSYDQGFKSFKDVEDYLKKYSKK